MKWLERLLARPIQVPNQSGRITTVTGCVEFEGKTLELRTISRWHERLPHPDFRKARNWARRVGGVDSPTAWLAVQRAWLQWLAASLGKSYRLHESDDALLLTSAGPRAAKIALDYLTLTHRRISRSLGRLAIHRLDDKQVAMLIASDGDYYRYISGQYPRKGKFPMSAGVHIGGPGAHFVVNGSDLTRVEATIVHEMTHACVAHLPIPTWLDEGLAVNMEIAFGRVADAHTLIALEKLHRTYWTPKAIQDFWSGRAYKRPDEGRKLSYDLGRLMVAGMTEHWPRFEAFALDARVADSGKRAAEDHLGIDLGEYVRHFLERDQGAWGPRPATWEGEPERGAF